MSPILTIPIVQQSLVYSTKQYWYPKR